MTAEGGRIACVLALGAAIGGPAVAAAYEAPAPLARARADYRAVAEGEDPDARGRFGGAWQQAEAAEDEARRAEVVRAGVAASTRGIAKAEERLLAWAAAQRAELESLAGAPEAVAGPRERADSTRATFFQAADEWKVLVTRLGGRAPAGAAVDEYVTTTAILLRALRAVADAGGAVKGRFLLAGFDAVGEVDSAAELHRQASALAAAHQGGDRGAADRARDLGWGAAGPPSDLAGALADLAAYRAEAEAFRRTVEGAVSRVATGSAPAAAGPAPAGGTAEAHPGPAADAGGGAAGIHATLDAAMASLGAPVAAGGTGGYLVHRQGLSDPDAAAFGWRGGLLRVARGGLALPGGLREGILARLADATAAEDSTSARYGRVLAAFTPERQAALEAALDAGNAREAAAAYAEVTGQAPDVVKARVEALLARRRSGDKVAKALAKAPSGAQLLALVPAGRETPLSDAEHLAASKDPGPLMGSDVALPVVAAYLPPPPRADGQAGGDAALQAAHDAAIQAAMGPILAWAQALDERARAAQADVEAASAAARQGHLDALRDAGFGPIPASCPAGEEVSLCPERHILPTHPGRCRPAGLTCDGPAAVELGFP